MNLEDHAESIAWELAFWMEGLTDPTYPIDQLGDLSLELSVNFRALAIIALLVKGDTNLYCHHLIRSGLARETYLKRLHREGVENDHHRASGRFDPLIDAIAANEFQLATRIADLSPQQWYRNHEYEDDYCFAQILHRMIQENIAQKEIAPFLDQFEACIEGSHNARIDVCRALVKKEQAAFDTAFSDRIDQREAEIAADMDRGQSDDPIVVAQRHVFVEGLALLRLAEWRGLETQPEYRYCPSPARLPMSEPFPGE